VQVLVLPEERLFVSSCCSFMIFLVSFTGAGDGDGDGGGYHYFSSYSTSFSVFELFMELSFFVCVKG
ncbi:MAG: hypothetical protein ACI8RD_004814, partial [Bacillariaceae sp.]